MKLLGDRCRTRGDADACETLGDAYAIGELGLAVSDRKAERLWERADELRDATSAL